MVVSGAGHPHLGFRHNPGPPAAGGQQGARQETQKHRARSYRFSNGKICGCNNCGQIANIRYSLAGQDTRLSPERPGLESRWRNSLPIAPARQLVAAPLWSLSQPIDTALYDEFWQRQGKNIFLKKNLCNRSPMRLVILS